MRFRVSFLTLIAGLIVAGGFVAGQEGKKIRGTLPPGYGKLGLSDEQKQSIYKVQARYEDQISKLEEQLKDLRQRRQREIHSVLTAAQRLRLRELAAEKLPAEETKKPDK